MTLGELSCVTAAQKAAAQSACAQRMAVQGLGVTGDPNDPCWVASLPICGPGLTTNIPAIKLPEPGSSAGLSTLAWGGLLLLVLAGGGYVLYRGAKKR